MTAKKQNAKMGRPRLPKAKKRVVLAVAVAPETAAHLNAYAKKMKLSRSAAANVAIQNGLIVLTQVGLPPMSDGDPRHWQENLAAAKRVKK